MRRRAVLLAALVIMAAACGDDGDDSSGVPSWLERTTDLRPPELERQEVDGVEVFVDEAERVIYVESCDDGEDLTAEGAPFGPEDGPGFAYICPS